MKGTNPMSQTVCLESIGHLAATAGVSVVEVQRILREIGVIEPAYFINAIPHYSGDVAGTVIARARGWSDQAAYYRRYDAEIQS